MRYRLFVNGLDGPLLNQFGCECGRCSGPTRQANTSVSLIGLDEDGNTACHLLFDIGLGVVDSLLANPHLARSRARLDGIILTHWHPDHTSELNRLCVSHHFNRLRRGLPAPRVPLYCRDGTAAWLSREQSHVVRTYLDPQLTGEYSPPGAVLDPIPLDLPGLTVTPVTVAHYTADLHPETGAVAYSCAAYVIQTAQTKIVLLWDIDSENHWLTQPGNATEEDAVALLSAADLLFIDTTFWHRRAHRTTHPSFENVKDYANALRPQQTYLVHLSGHPDGPGRAGFGWSNAQWTAGASAEWARAGLSGMVAAPEIGQVFELG